MHNTLRLKNKTMPAFALTACALACGQVWAQEAAPVEGASLGEVVVTATRVKTSAQKTPVSLSVYNGQQLSESGVTNVQALQSIDSSVNLSQSSGASYVAIRGVASTDVTETGDPSVSIARDGFFTNRAFSITTGFYDMQRVEVLKGPQGTLFGRNSTGGLINIVTARPEKIDGGYVSAELGTYSTRNFEGALNKVLADNAQFRLSAMSRRHTGYRNVTGINQRGDDDDTQSVRAQLALQPLTGLQTLLAYQHDVVDDVGDLSKNYPLATAVPLGDSKTFPGTASTYNKITGDRLRWEVSYDQLPAGWVAEYQGGIDKQEWQHALDGTDQAETGAYPANRQFRQHEKPTTWNHEVRLISPKNGALSGQFGFFHFQEKNTVDSGVYNVEMVNPAPGSNDYSGQYGIKFDYNLKTKSDGLFGQVSYDLSPGLKLNAGARYTKESKERDGAANLIIGALVDPHVPPFVTVNTPGGGTASFSKPTFLLGMDWTLSADNFLYAKYATGFKSGGFNNNGSGAPVPYGPESVGSFEVGSKNRFMNRRVQFNATLFSQNYKGYQAFQMTDVLSSGGIFNVGSARIKGLETTLIADVDGVARFDASATLLHTKFGQGIVINDAAGNDVDISGNHLPNAPRTMFTVGVERPFQVGAGSIKLRAFAKHSSDYYFSVSNTPDEYAPSYTTYNLSAVYSPDSGKWSAQVYVDNVTDVTVVSYAKRNYVPHADNVQFAPPRTAGLRVRYNF